MTKYEKTNQIITNSIFNKIKAGEVIDYLSISDEYQVDTKRVFRIIEENKLQHIVPSRNMNILLK